MFNYDQIIEKAAIRKDALKALEEALQLDTCNTVINELAEVYEYTSHLSDLFRNRLDQEGREMFSKEIHATFYEVFYTVPKLAACLENLRKLRDQLHGE